MMKGELVGTCSSDFVQTILRVRYSPPHFYYELLSLSMEFIPLQMLLVGLPSSLRYVLQSLR